MLVYPMIMTANLPQSSNIRNTHWVPFSAPLSLLGFKCGSSENNGYRTDIMIAEPRQRVKVVKRELRSGKPTSCTMNIVGPINEREEAISGAENPRPAPVLLGVAAKIT